MSFINKLNQNLPGCLIHIPDRLQGNMLKPKKQYRVLMMSYLF